MGWTNQGHVFDAIGHNINRKIGDKKNLYVYGAGVAAKELLEVIRGISKFIAWNVFLIDKDPKKQSEGRYGYPVMSPEAFFATKKDSYFLVVGADGAVGDEIFNILKSNLGSEEVIFKSFYFLNTILPIYFSYVHDMVYFSSENILLSTVCNLNCRDCLNFTPYLKKHYIETFEQIVEDVDLFFNAVDYIYKFQLTGGEPFLYKDIVQVINYIGDNYRDKIMIFEIVTNGTIVPGDELCSALEKHKMRVYLDDYRCTVDNGNEKYEKCLNKLKNYKIDVIENHVEQWFRMYIPEIDEMRDEDENELIQKFRSCSNPYSNLWHGKISTCNYGFYAYKAGLCEWDETGAYDLKKFDKTKKKELVEFRLRNCENGYVSFCKKCNGWLSINNRCCEPAIQHNRED